MNRTNSNNRYWNGRSYQPTPEQQQMLPHQQNQQQVSPLLQNLQQGHYNQLNSYQQLQHFSQYNQQQHCNQQLQQYQVAEPHQQLQYQVAEHHHNQGAHKSLQYGYQQWHSNVPNNAGFSGMNTTNFRSQDANYSQNVGTSSQYQSGITQRYQSNNKSSLESKTSGSSPGRHSSNISAFHNNSKTPAQHNNNKNGRRRQFKRKSLAERLDTAKVQKTEEDAIQIVEEKKTSELPVKCVEGFISGLPVECSANMIVCRINEELRNKFGYSGSPITYVHCRQQVHVLNFPEEWVRSLVVRNFKSLLDTTEVASSLEISTSFPQQDIAAANKSRDPITPLSSSSSDTNLPRSSVVSKTTLVSEKESSIASTTRTPHHVTVAPGVVDLESSTIPSFLTTSQPVLSKKKKRKRKANITEEKCKKNHPRGVFPGGVQPHSIVVVVDECVPYFNSKLVKAKGHTVISGCNLSVLDYIDLVNAHKQSFEEGTLFVIVPWFAFFLKNLQLLPSQLENSLSDADHSATNEPETLKDAQGKKRYISDNGSWTDSSTLLDIIKDFQHELDSQEVATLSSKNAINFSLNSSKGSKETKFSYARRVLAQRLFYSALLLRSTLRASFDNSDVVFCGFPVHAMNSSGAHKLFSDIPIVLPNVEEFCNDLLVCLRIFNEFAANTWRLGYVSKISSFNSTPKSPAKNQAHRKRHSSAEEDIEIILESSNSSINNTTSSSASSNNETLSSSKSCGSETPNARVLYRLSDVVQFSPRDGRLKPPPCLANNRKRLRSRSPEAIILDLDTDASSSQAMTSKSCDESNSKKPRVLQNDPREKESSNGGNKVTSNENDKNSVNDSSGVICMISDNNHSEKDASIGKPKDIEKKSCTCNISNASDCSSLNSTPFEEDSSSPQISATSTNEMVNSSINQSHEETALIRSDTKDKQPSTAEKVTTVESSNTAHPAEDEAVDDDNVLHIDNTEVFDDADCDDTENNKENDDDDLQIIEVPSLNRKIHVRNDISIEANSTPHRNFPNENNSVKKVRNNDGGNNQVSRSESYIDTRNVTSCTNDDDEVFESEEEEGEEEEDNSESDMVEYDEMCLDPNSPTIPVSRLYRHKWFGRRRRGASGVHMNRRTENTSRWYMEKLMQLLQLSTDISNNRCGLVPWQTPAPQSGQLSHNFLHVALNAGVYKCLLPRKEVYWCNVCDVEVRSNSAADQHLYSWQHCSLLSDTPGLDYLAKNKLLGNHPMENTIPLSKDYVDRAVKSRLLQHRSTTSYFCSVCRHTVTSPQLRHHVNSERHLSLYNNSLGLSSSPILLAQQQHWQLYRKILSRHPGMDVIIVTDVLNHAVLQPLASLHPRVTILPYPDFLSNSAGREEAVKWWTNSPHFCLSEEVTNASLSENVATFGPGHPETMENLATFGPDDAGTTENSATFSPDESSVTENLASFHPSNSSSTENFARNFDQSASSTSENLITFGQLAVDESAVVTLESSTTSEETQDNSASNLQSSKDHDASVLSKNSTNTSLNKNVSTTDIAEISSSDTATSNVDNSTSNVDNSTSNTDNSTSNIDNSTSNRDTSTSSQDVSVIRTNSSQDSTQNKSAGLEENTDESKNIEETSEESALCKNNIPSQTKDAANVSNNESNKGVAETNVSEVRSMEDDTEVNYEYDDTIEESSDNNNSQTLTASTGDQTNMEATVAEDDTGSDEVSIIAHTSAEDKDFGKVANVGNTREKEALLVSDSDGCVEIIHDESENGADNANAGGALWLIVTGADLLLAKEESEEFTDIDEVMSKVYDVHSYLRLQLPPSHVVLTAPAMPLTLVQDSLSPSFRSSIMGSANALSLPSHKFDKVTQLYKLLFSRSLAVHAANAAHENINRISKSAVATDLVRAVTVDSMGEKGKVDDGVASHRLVWTPWHVAVEALITSAMLGMPCRRLSRSNEALKAAAKAGLDIRDLEEAPQLKKAMVLGETKFLLTKLNDQETVTLHKRWLDFDECDMSYVLHLAEKVKEDSPVTWCLTAPFPKLMMQFVPNPMCVINRCKKGLRLWKFKDMDLASIDIKMKSFLSELQCKLPDGKFVNVFPAFPCNVVIIDDDTSPAAHRALHLMHTSECNTFFTDENEDSVRSVFQSLSNAWRVSYSSSKLGHTLPADHPGIVDVNILHLTEEVAQIHDEAKRRVGLWKTAVEAYLSDYGSDVTVAVDLPDVRTSSCEELVILE